MQKDNERGKTDEQIEKFIEDNWQLLLIIGGIAALYYFRDKLLNYVLTFWESWQQEILISVIVLAVLLIVRTIFVWWHMKNHYQYVTALPHIADEVDATAILQMIRSVHGAGRRPFERLIKGREWFRVLFHTNKDGKIRIYLGFPDDCARRVQLAFSTLYPKAEFYPASFEDVPMPTKRAVGGRMVMRRKKEDATLSLAKYYKKDVLPDVLQGLEKQSWLDLSFSADSGRDLTKGIRKAEKNLRKRKKKNDYGLDPFEHEERKSLGKRYSGNETAFRVCVSLASNYYDKQQKKPGVNVIKGVGGAIASVMSDVNEIRFRRWRHAINEIPFPTYGRMTWTGSELANLVHLPTIPEDTKTPVVHLEKGQEMLLDDQLSDGVGIGTLAHPLQRDRVIRVDKNQFKKHGMITGKTGSAKSTVAVSLTKFLQDEWISNESHEGFTFFDPAE
ncbi:MAG TPA: ATP-binding protein, partial [Pseudogracilibacillus sp.]|nr:ATP-binding protein [Pseudogracilibacillus sp.]